MTEMVHKKKEFNQLLLVGGVSASEKTTIIDELARVYRKKHGLQANDNWICPFTVSKYLIEKLNDPSLTNREALPDYHWRDVEEEAVRQIIDDINNKFRSHISVMNCHYAVASPGGFLPGLRMGSLIRICRKVLASSPANGEKIAAVVLIESKIEEILGRKRARYFLSTRDVIADLEFNRLYSESYYHTITETLPKRSTLHLTVAHNSATVRTTAENIYNQLNETGFF